MLGPVTHQYCLHAFKCPPFMGIWALNEQEVCTTKLKYYATHVYNWNCLQYRLRRFILT